MKTELPATGDGGNLYPPFYRWHRVCMAIATAAAIDDEVLRLTTRSATRFLLFPRMRYLLRNPVKCGLLRFVVTNLETLYPARIRLRTNLRPEQVLQNEGVVALLRSKYGCSPGASGTDGNAESFPLSLPALVYSIGVSA